MVSLTTAVSNNIVSSLSYTIKKNKFNYYKKY